MKNNLKFRFEADIILLMLFNTSNYIIVDVNNIYFRQVIYFNCLSSAFSFVLQSICLFCLAISTIFI